MGYVTHTTTEYVGELTQSTSVHFEEFADFVAWQKDQEVEYAVEESGKIPWRSHDGLGNPLDPETEVIVQFKNGDDAEGRSIDFYGWDWDTKKIDGYEEGYQIVGYKLI